MLWNNASNANRSLLVGKIRNNNLSSNGDYVYKGKEKGYFEFGGSTIILLFKKDTICFNEKLYLRQNCNGEIFVHRGEFIIKAKKTDKH